MKTVGLITEYNPFHNGHKYHMEEARRLSGADYVIVVMSGNFVQRGAPAVIDKYSRTEMALQQGADLVLELPVCYATGSAEFFAHGAVSLLDKLGVVDYLCFGSECGQLKLLMQVAKFLSTAPGSYQDSLRTCLKAGLTYPAARLKALTQSLEGPEAAEAHLLAQVLAEPNNILGIEYLKALLYFQSDIQPLTLKRISSHYHDIHLSGHLPGPHSSLSEAQEAEAEQQEEIISSATSVRRALQQETASGRDLCQIKNSVPVEVFKMLQTSHTRTCPITEEDFSALIKYRLLTEDRKTLSGYQDITGDLADRLKKIADYNKTISELAQDIKTKNMTLTRINRALLHLLLNIRTENVREYNKNGYTQYARILGLRKQSSTLLRQIEEVCRLPLLTRVSNAKELLPSLGLQMLSEDITAAHLYNQAVYEKYHSAILNEYRHGTVIL